MVKPGETLEGKVARVLAERIEISSYDASWPAAFESEKQHLLGCLPSGMIRRIEHFGSTAVPGLPAKPVIDMLVEVRSLEETRVSIVPILEMQGYDYFWRPAQEDDVPPYYAWFIKRDGEGHRTHHIHMVEAHFEHWDRLLFRDYLIAHPDIAREYAELKTRLAAEHGNDRVLYTRSKGDFIRRVTETAKRDYEKD